MPKKVLLIYHSPVAKKYYLNFSPPLGILSISSYLSSKGIENKVVDCCVENLDSSNIKDYDVLGFSVNKSNAPNSLHCAAQIKKDFPQKKIVFGGPQCTEDPGYFIEKGFIDATVSGEGEETLYEYLTKEDPRQVKGLYLKGKNGETIFTGEREYIDNLDTLPFPALDKIDIRKYWFIPKRAMPTSSIVTSRGCPYNCTFCFHSLGYKWRARSAENVVDEIEWQVKSLKVKEICILDDNFSLDRIRVERICDLIIKRRIKVNVQLSTGVRVDKVDKELLIKLKEAGIYMVSIAPESGNTETKKRIKKNFDADKMKELVDCCKKLGLRTFAFFIIGFPWEDRKEIEKTIEFAIELDTDFVKFTRFVLTPSIPIWNEIRDANTAINLDPGAEQSYFYGGSIFVRKLMRTAYRRFYLRPQKVLRLLKIMRPDDVLSLTKYALNTRNIL